MVAENPEDIIRRARNIYESRLRAAMEAGHPGEYLVLNVETGEYEVDPDDVVASRRAKVRFPDAILFTLRVGYPTAYGLGGRSLIATRLC